MFSGLRQVSGNTPDLFRDIKQVSFDAVFATPVPEPGTWAMMIAGFGFVGGAMRRRRRRERAFA